MDTFCVLPWVGREINWNARETHCCLLPENYDIDQIKSDLLAGVKTSACQKCWNLEEYGSKSDRQVKNTALDFYWDRDIESIKQDAIDDKLNDILMLKLLTSYTCNATCISCGPGASSSWTQLIRRDNPEIQLNSYKFIDIDKIKTKVDFKELKMLSLIGGEPLYEKKNFDLLEYLVEIGNTNVFLSMVTNGSVKLTSRQKQVLSKFKNINFSVSIDGIESVFEYMRYPLDWTDLNNNLTFFRELTDNISSNYTLSNLNILYHNKTIEWFDKNSIVYSVNPIYNPVWLQPRALPMSIKKILKRQLSAVDYNTFIGPIHTDQDQQNFQLMLEQINIQDTSKKIQMKDYLPELHNMLTQY
jgi:sulfatase maturation enzyme AslB (radical SAM superfamily)